MTKLISLQKIINSLPAHIYWLDTNMTIIGCNSQQAEFFGNYNVDELIGKSLYEILNINDANSIIANNKLVITSSRPHNFQETVHLNGSDFNFLSKKIPLRDESDNIVGVLGVSLNITDSKNNEKDKELILEKLISHMPGHIYWQDKNGVILGSNDMQAKSFGFASSKDIIGKTAYDLLPKEQADTITRINNEVMAKGGTHVVEENLTFEYGYAHVLSQKVPLYDNYGKLKGIMGISFDITKQKEAEKKLAEQIIKTEKAYRSKGRFIAQASHEIRNPISSVSSILILTKERLDKLQIMIYEKVGSLKDADSNDVEELNKMFKEIFDFYNTAAEKADATLNALKNLEKLHLLEINGLKPKWLQNRISELIEDAVKINSYDINKKAIELKINIMNDVPSEALIDYDHICDAISIIIGNAVRFSMGNAQVLIDVKSYNDGSNAYLDFVVRDFGVGIAKEQLEDLFKSEIEDEFTTDERLRKPSVQLKRAKLMIEASGGKLLINSILKLGTTVIIRTPFRLPEKQGLISDLNKEMSIQLEEIRACKILVIEDDEAIQKTTVQQLNELGFYNIDVASSGREALKKGMQNNYAIMFVDFSLPDINGIRIVEQLLHDKNQDIIFIGITSHTSEEIEAHALKSGVMEVLFKPVSKSSLAQTLKAAQQIISDGKKTS